ncbi:MAG: LytTR family DNA-binding domain-containing protein [Raineya sp.]
MHTYTCVAVDDSESQLTLLKNYIKKTDYLTLEGVFSNPIEAHKYLSNSKVDILFLDIDMPEISGLDLMKMLQSPPQTILVTSKTEFALDAFNLDAVDYIIKPTEYHRFLKAVNKAINLLERQKPTKELKEEAIFIKLNGKFLRLEVDEIEYFEAMADYVVIHTEDKRSYIVYSTLKHFEAKMAEFGKFYRIHRSYLIHLHKIKSIENGQVLMSDRLLPIGNTYKEAFLKKLNTI